MLQTAAAENARLLASLPAKLHAELQTRSARTKITNNKSQGRLPEMQAVFYGFTPVMYYTAGKILKKRKEIIRIDSSI